MEKIVLSGNTQTITLEGLTKPQSLVFSQISATTKISVEVQRVGQDTQRLIVPIKVQQANEAQQKILKDALSRPIIPIEKSVNRDGKTILHVVDILLVLNGEVPLGNNDKIIIKLTDMDGVGGAIFIKGSNVDSEDYFKIVDQSFDGKGLEKRIDVNKFSFLIFDKDESKFPQLIERFYASTDNRRDNYEDITIESNIKYGAVSNTSILTSVSDGEATIEVSSLLQTYGSDTVLVVDVRGLATLTLKDDRRQEYNFWAVKL